MAVKHLISSIVDKVKLPRVGLAKLLALSISLSQVPSCKPVSQSDDPRQQSVAGEVQKLETDPCQDPFVQSEEVKRLVASLGSSNICGILKLRDFPQTKEPITQEKIIQYLTKNYPTWICKVEDRLNEPFRVIAAQAEGEVYLVLVSGTRQLPEIFGSNITVISYCSLEDCQNLNCFILHWLLQQGKDAVLEVDLVRYLKNLNLDDPDRLKELARNPFLARLLDRSLAQDLKAIANEPNKLIRTSKIIAFLDRDEKNLNALKKQFENDKGTDTDYERCIEIVVALQIASYLVLVDRKEDVNKFKIALMETTDFAEKHNNYPSGVINTLKRAQSLMTSSAKEGRN